ncbi:hypothetical protein ACI48D_24645, partial [Massilia sp. LXY-6]|uniref:hypothetical protein n=1 Tax=Massilia sp. LXY-6 TaxID=3379823 RepID=UPI003EE1232B
WSGALQSSGNVQLVASDQPSAMPSSKALRLGWAQTPTTAQQSVLATAQGYVPSSTQTGFTVAIWARNPGKRTLTFRLRLFDATTKHLVQWNCAVDPLDRWILLTMSPSQQASSTWDLGHDAVGAVRLEQQDDTPEGPWQPDDYLLFGDIYAGVPGQPLFLITFDDGFDSQRNAAPPPDMSGYRVTSSDNGVFVTDGQDTVAVGASIIFPTVAPTGLAPGVRYWVRTVPARNTFTLATDATLSTGVASSGFAGSAPFSLADGPQRSGQQIVESYGFKGSVFLVPGWLGTMGVYGYGSHPNKFLSAADAKAMYAEGWSIGSHSNTHPSSAENAGLRLLGPYGYFLSNPVDFLPAQYVRAWGLNASFRRRAIKAAAGSNVVSFENPHRFLVNMPIVFTDDAPSGFVPGITYYCQSIPSPATATFASDQGSLNATVKVRADWTGLGQYRYAGSAPDDSAIYKDIMAGIAGVQALGIPTGGKYFALPQGGADIYVRSACLRSGLKWIRGASAHAHTFAVGYPTGGGLSAIANTPGGWLAQTDCIQTDNTIRPSISDIVSYIDEGIAQHACGCSYHHMVDGATTANLENMCATLRARADQGLVKVVTLDQMDALLRRQ